MAGFTYIGGIDVAGGFTTGGGAIVTTETGADYLIMIHCIGGHRCPGCRTRQVAGVTRIGAIDMVGRFSTGNRAVVTTGAGANHMAMIHRARLYWCPRCRSRLVAGITGVGRINV